jgi:hydroxyacylglutathione hydrolase
MTLEITVIEFPMRILGFNIITVNCYLIKTGAGYFLIDTGSPNNRAELEKKLEEAGCHLGDLKLIILTHGDLDHTGNCSFLRDQYGAKIVMQRNDSGVVEKGDDTLSRRKMSFPKRVMSRVILGVLSFLMRSGKFERFKPDLEVDEGYDLSGYGLDAKVLYLPGHSRGSIGVLTDGGDLFCGDLLWNMSRPGAHSIVDDREEMKLSVEKLRGMNINTVYPGHGKPFQMKELITSK